MGTELNIIKSEARLNINLWFLSLCFTLFTFIVAINPGLLKGNPFVSIQLTLAIPLFITSVFARSRLAYTQRMRLWEEYGFITFTIAYGFFLNVVGILLANLAGKNVGIIFFVCNILCTFLYSTVEVIEDRKKMSSRIYKDLFLILMFLCLGLFPILS